MYMVGGTRGKGRFQLHKTTLQMTRAVQIGDGMPQNADFSNPGSGLNLKG